MPNPSPTQTEKFIKKRFKRQDKSSEPLAEKMFGVRLPADVDAAVRSLSNPSAWLRKVITEAARREGLIDGENS